MIGIILCLPILLSIISFNWSQIRAATDAAIPHEMWISYALKEPLLIPHRLRQSFTSEMVSWAASLTEVVIFLPCRICALSYHLFLLVRGRCHVLALIEVILKTVFLQVGKCYHYVFLIGVGQILSVSLATNLARGLMVIGCSRNLVCSW